MFLPTKDVEKQTISEDKEVVANMWGDSLSNCLKHLTGKYKTKKQRQMKKSGRQMKILKKAKKS